ncbi:uncharacterized protein MELLADRAFT_92564 [Melampsora larici-populina 98AG31]|uniref:Uncharacterized protein n=1 Tax=Melampsora larici-populina (strain 98AG31 / pathotype 3-4-7) TaxID=747676 RepID=F4S204_MELLP|nr:uncharacterized protein MELLADRAFT_92564 [Melampsora larici-populina 98AG31]EGG01348.1 hypothetical protein MELLADRAFT_92564 [Melampsora larici-populina 98AG31]
MDSSVSWLYTSQGNSDGRHDCGCTRGEVRPPFCGARSAVVASKISSAPPRCIPACAPCVNTFPLSSHTLQSKVNRRSQPAYVSSIFEVHAQVPTTVNAAYGFRSVTSGINCAGINGSSPLEHELFITYYAAQGIGLAVGNMHYTSGKFLPLNGEPIPRIVTELSHHIPAGDADTFSGCLTNNVSLNSIGIVVSKRVVQEEAHEGKPTCVFLMRHTDYNPMTGKLCEFLLEYWCRPVQNLVKALNIIQIGKETSVHGYIAGKHIQSNIVGGREVKSYTFQVEVYSISVATGHESIRAGATLATPTATRMTKGGRVRLARATETTPHNGNIFELHCVSPSALHASGAVEPMPKPTAEDHAALASYLQQVANAATDENVNPTADAMVAGPSGSTRLQEGKRRKL